MWAEKVPECLCLWRMFLVALNCLLTFLMLLLILLFNVVVMALFIAGAICSILCPNFFLFSFVFDLFVDSQYFDYFLLDNFADFHFIDSFVVELLPSSV